MIEMFTRSLIATFVRHHFVQVDVIEPTGGTTAVQILLNDAQCASRHRINVRIINQVEKPD